VVAVVVVVVVDVGRFQNPEHPARSVAAASRIKPYLIFIVTPGRTHTQDHHFVESPQKQSVSRVAPAGTFCPPLDPTPRGRNASLFKKTRPESFPLNGKSHGRSLWNAV
jgi:hypothetical protein